jgi:hypothetical protein
LFWCIKKKVLYLGISNHLKNRKMDLSIIRKVADRFTDTFNEEIEDRLTDEGLDATEQEVDAVIEEIVKIYK